MHYFDWKFEMFQYRPAKMMFVYFTGLVSIDTTQDKKIMKMHEND